MMTETSRPAIGSKIPLLFTYRDALFGNDFVVDVNAENGRALCVYETDGHCWMYGVNPGGMAAFGEDPDTAHAAFREMFSSILKDLATEAKSFDEFRALVSAFFNDTNPGYQREWSSAVEAVRNGQIAVEGIPRASADSPRQISIEMKIIFKSRDNEANLEPALAA